MERYLRVNLLGPGPLLMKKGIYRAAVSQRLRNTGVDYPAHESFWFHPKRLHVFAILLGVIRPAGSNIQA